VLILLTLLGKPGPARRCIRGHHAFASPGPASSRRDRYLGGPIDTRDKNGPSPKIRAARFVDQRWRGTDAAPAKTNNFSVGEGRVCCVLAGQPAICTRKGVSPAIVYNPFSGHPQFLTGIVRIPKRVHEYRRGPCPEGGQGNRGIDGTPPIWYRSVFF